MTNTIPRNHNLAFQNEQEYANKEVQKSISSLSTYLYSIKSLVTDTVFRTLELSLKQLEDSYNYWHINSTGKQKFRDKMMAENIQSMMKLLTFEKVFIWAHNNHVRTHDYGVVRIGEYLKTSFGEKYLSIATVFGEGTYRVYYKGALSVMNLPISTCGELANYIGTYNGNYLLFQKQNLPTQLSNKKVYIHDVGVMQTMNNPEANKYRLVASRDFDMYIYIKTIQNLALPD